MVEATLAGVSVGYFSLILIRELSLFECRLCTVFWLSVVYSLLWQNLLAIGLVNLVAHVSFMIFDKVTQDGFPTTMEISVRMQEGAASESSTRGDVEGGSQEAQQLTDL